MHTKKTFEIIRSKILLTLDNNLAKDLLYHCTDHTIDVEMQAERIALNEKIFNQDDLFLLKVACLYHDSGFIFTYNEHETAGCNLAMNELPAYGLSSKELDIIRGLIMATKLPQTPQSRLEEVICDADLDYLGRDDFFSISNNLFLEFRSRGFVASENEWNRVQIKFFKEHKYFTDTTKILRERKKLEHLEMIEALI
ncbi:MAG: HD domain-containing protein [Ferruginibacter sp.]